jgi:hypothetical protein
LLIALASPACAPPERPPASGAVQAYLQQLEEWAPEEAEVGRGVRRILETQFVDDGEVRRQLAEVQPRIDAQLSRMRGYRPPAGPIGDLHQAYVVAWAGLQQGCREIAEGLDAAEQDRLGRGRRQLVAWREALPAVAKRVRELLSPEMEQGPPT